MPVTVNASGLRQKLERVARDTVATAGVDMVNDLRSTAPVGDTGALQQSIAPPQLTNGGYGVHLEVGVDYASFVNDGTRPHRIDGNPLLAFEMDGDDVVVRFVNHPGTEAQPFWDDVIDKWADYLADAFEQVSGR